MVVVVVIGRRVLPIMLLCMCVRGHEQLMDENRRLKSELERYKSILVSREKQLFELTGVDRTSETF